MPNKCTVVFILCCCCAWINCQNLQYTITYSSTSNANGVFIRIQLVQPMASSKFEFVMPRTIPGGYNLIMYDSFVSNVTATGYKDTGLVQNVAMIKDGARWRVQSLQQVDTISQILYFVDIQQQEQQLYASNDASKIRKEVHFL